MMRGVTLSANGDGQYCLQQGKGDRKLDKFNADTMAGNIKHKLNGKTLLAKKAVGKIAILHLVNMLPVPHS